MTPSPASREDAPVFLVGWWRSGTTFFWNLLQDADGYTGYFEPLHEHLDVYLDDDRPDRVDPTHPDVHDYWTEYRALPRDDLEAAWEPWFGRERHALGPDDDAPDLQAYLDLLIDEAPGRPVLKLVRGPLRAPWLRATFPEATLIHVARNPRSVWTSTVGRDAETDDPPPDERHGLLHNLTRVADELGIVQDDHMYRVLYRTWVRAFQEAEAVASDTWWYEAAVRDPEAWAREHLVETGLREAVPDVDVDRSSLEPGHHPPEWYQAQEAAVADAAEPAGDGDPRVDQLLRENRHLADEKERLLKTVETLEGKYERALDQPTFRVAVRLYRRLRAALGRPVD